MRPYVTMAGARFRCILQYRAAAFAGAVTQVFWGFIRIMIFAAFYAAGTGAQPMALREVVAYVWLSQACFRMLPWAPDPQIQSMFRTGAVAHELLRPVDLYFLWYARNLALLTAQPLMRALPVLAVAVLVAGLDPPASVASGLAWAAATAGAVVLGAALLTLIAATFFWTLAAEGVVAFNTAAIILLTGMVIPLPLFPGWAQTALAILPFRGLLDTPLRLYLGHLPPEAVLRALGHQLAWTLLLVAAGRSLVARGARRVVIQGG